MKCKNCGADLVDGVKFCGQCGESVAYHEDHTKIYQEDLKPGEVKDPAQEEFEEIIEEVEAEEEFEQIIDDAEKISQATGQSKDEFQENEDQGSSDEDLISGPVFDRDKKPEGEELEAKPAGLIKIIALVSMVLMGIFALVYAIDLLRLVFYSIGGLF